MDLDNYIKEYIKSEVEVYLDKHFKNYISSHTAIEKEFYCRAEAAKKLGVTQYTIKQLEGKKLDVVYINQNSPRITKDSLEQYKMELKEQAVRYKLN